MMATDQRSDERAHAFSLVEMLVVMTVIILLMTLTVPALNSFTKSNSLGSGGDMVTNLVALARQTATSKNTMTALVLLGKQDSVDADYRAFTVLQYNLDQQTWVQNTPWQSLPTGVIVDFYDTQNCTFVTVPPIVFPSLSNGQKSPPASYQTQPVKDYAARIFLPNGGLLNAQDGAQIRLVEGSRQGDKVAYTHPKANALPANWYDVAILGATGQTKVSRP